MGTAGQAHPDSHVQLERNGDSWEERREDQILFSNKKLLRNSLYLQLAVIWGTELNSVGCGRQWESEDVTWDIQIGH